MLWGENRVGVEDAKRKSRNGRVEVTTTTRTPHTPARWPSASATLLKRRRHRGYIAEPPLAGTCILLALALAQSPTLVHSSFVGHLHPLSSTPEHRPAIRKGHTPVPHESRVHPVRPIAPLEPLQASPTCPVPPSRNSRVCTTAHHHPSSHPRSSHLMHCADRDFPEFMDRRLFLHLQGGRQVSGVLRGFDMFLNLVVDNAHEELGAGQRKPCGMIVSRRGVVGVVLLASSGRRHLMIVLCLECWEFREYLECLEDSCIAGSRLGVAVGMGLDIGSGLGTWAGRPSREVRWTGGSGSRARAGSPRASGRGLLDEDGGPWSSDRR
jgi:small nuclear ribonucleoprotein G